MDVRIAMSGEIARIPISHWYLDADAKTINFLFREDRERVFLRDLGDNEGSVGIGTGAGDVGVTLCFVSLLLLLS